MAGVIDALRQRLGTLPRQEAAVARAILADPNAALHIAIARLAAQAQVSQPTVLRLCRTLGYGGFPAFKVALAQSLVPGGIPFVSAHVQPDDTAAAYAPKVLDAAATALRMVRNRLDTGAVAGAVARLANARQILVAGYGGSAPTALDAVHKLSRFSIPCRMLGDQVLALMAVETALPGDVLLAISNSGRTAALVDLAQQAAQRNIVCIALTAPGSPLAAYAGLALQVEPAEDTAIFTPMASRLVHLAIVDILMTGLALRLGSPAQETFARLKGALARTRLGA